MVIMSAHYTRCLEPGFGFRLSSFDPRIGGSGDFVRRLGGGSQQTNPS